MNLKEQLISAATTHNEAVAIEKAKNIYDKIIEQAKRAATIGQYSTMLRSNGFSELYRVSMGENDEVRIRMIQILKNKFKEEGLEFEYISSCDTFGEDYYELRWYKN